MSDEQQDEKRSYREAQADAKAAAARAKALRPWYKKKRYILGGLVGIFFVLGIIGSLAEEEPESTGSAAASTGGTGANAAGGSTVSDRQNPAPTSARPGPGDTAKVGDLDLTLISVDSVNSAQYNQFNDANIVLRVRAVNSRGDSYSFQPLLALKIIDANGVAHSPTSCTGCPDEIGVGGAELVKGGRIEGNVYYSIPSQSGTISIREIHFQSFLSSNEVTFSTR